MLFIYFSRTKNIENLVKKLQSRMKFLEAIDATNDFSMKIHRKFFLLTYTDMLGRVPIEVEEFLKNNSEFLKGVIGSGNRNFGENFCKAAKEISKQYSVPLLATFEFSSNDQELDRFCEKLVFYID